MFEIVTGKNSIRIRLVKAWLPVVLLLVTFFMTACKPLAIPGPSLVETGKPPISYEAFAKQYNKRVSKIDKLWAHSMIELEWVDQENKKQYEQGDGLLLVRKPDEMVLTIGKGGDVFFLLGCNPKQYWMMNLKPSGDDPKIAHVGSRNKIATSWPFPILPNDILALSGLFKMPEKQAGKWTGNKKRLTYETTFESVKTQGLYSQSKQTLSRWVFANEPGYPLVQREMLVDDKQVWLVKYARLTHVELDNTPPGGWPKIPSRIEINMVQDQTKVTLFLSDLTNAAKKFRKSDVLYNFEKLAKAYRVEKIEKLK